MRCPDFLPLVLLLSVACQAAEAGSADTSPKRTAATELVTAPVDIHRPKGALRIAGELRAFQQVALRARLPAYVRERKVDVGDRVKAGALLVVLAAPERIAERAEAEAELSAARARLRRLETASTREGAVAPLEVDNAKGSAAALEARLLALRELENELTVRAPFAGTITQRGADQGALVGAGGETPLVSIAELSRLRLTVAVPERYARAATRGARIQFRLEGDAPGTTREAAISRTSGLLESATRTLDVELDVDNADGTILAGSFAEVMWPFDSGDEHPWVPATAIVQSSDGQYVWVKRGNALAKVAVDEVVREGGMVAVRATLGKGELVVSRGSEDLVEGLQVSSGVAARP
jgi:membrane fusion protein, multidrug efflux system